MTQHPPRRRTDIAIIVAATLAVALLSTVAVNAYLDRDDRWTRLVTPSNEAPRQIMAVDRGLKVYVKTQAGNLYLCSGGSWRDACSRVETGDLPATKVPARWLTCAAGTFPQPPVLAGSVVDSLEVGMCAGVATYSKFVILGDGTMWQWSRTFSWVNRFVLATSGVIGLGLGLALGLLIVKLRSYLR